MYFFITSFIQNKMDVCDVKLEATAEQRIILEGPMTLKSLNVADFLGMQDYINKWIKKWLKDDNGPSPLPLCVENTLHCYKKLFRLYTKATVRAVAIGNIDWMRSHYIVAFQDIWKYVDYETINPNMFTFLALYYFPPFEDVSFVCGGRNIDTWKLFVDNYGASECLDTALKQRFSEGIVYCIDMGADLDRPEILKLALRLDPMPLTHLLMFNPPVSEAAYEDFLLWRSIGAIKDVARLEEYFWVNGFKETHN